MPCCATLKHAAAEPVWLQLTPTMLELCMTCLLLPPHHELSVFVRPRSPVRRKALGASGREVGVAAHGALKEAFQARHQAPQGVGEALRGWKSKRI